MPDKISGPNTVRVQDATPAIETGAYSAGDLIGELMPLNKFLGTDTGANAANRGALIQSVIIVDADAESANIDVVFFDENPSATTFTDNAALAVADADLAKIIGVVSVTDWKTFNNNSVGQTHNLAIPFVVSEKGGDLYAAMVSRSAPTYTAGTDLTLRVVALPLT